MLNGLNQWYQEAKSNRWFRYFTVFCRVVLALGFIPSGIVKVSGERFTALPATHPLGQYFDALHLTGFYYTFIGVGQLVTALLLLIPRTALLGAIFYFPIILNICVLTYAVRFEGTRITTFMLLASLYLLAWDFDRLKHIFLPKQSPPPTTSSNKFPVIFFGCVLAALISVVVINQFMFDIRPGNSQLECTNGCAGNDNPAACNIFCDCIYNQGKSLDACLDEYERAKVAGSR
ncbi:DoxX family protein [Dawidia soli]|uniref:DoxX family protein n=1 Tax=Dawidia soli TaxID=2782352 RepID=A0AAP2DF44_9BACT|nr:DoxX family protein [Dawidia soli]MBT1690107.1 DoxX family protein [Dawidia soli]